MEERAAGGTPCGSLVVCLRRCAGASPVCTHRLTCSPHGRTDTVCDFSWTRPPTVVGWRALAPQCPWFALPARGNPAPSQVSSTDPSRTEVLLDGAQFPL